MVSAMIGEAMKPVLSLQAELRTRIIGIDGNGTGREGELQRQNTKLTALDEGQIFIIKELAEIKVSTQTWNKETFYKQLPVWVGIAFALIGSVIGYLTYRAKIGQEVSKQGHSQVVPYDAGVH